MANSGLQLSDVPCVGAIIRANESYRVWCTYVRWWNVTEGA